MLSSREQVSQKIRNFLVFLQHPWFCQEIDEYISKAKEQSYKQVLDLGSKGMNVLMQTALKVENKSSANSYKFCFF